MRGDVTRLRAGAVLTIVLSCALTLAATPPPVAASSISIYIGTGAAGSGGSCSQPEYGTGGGDATPVFADAYDDIVTSGTIFLCAGTYDFETSPSTVLGGRSITITGAGKANTHLDGGDVRRIFDMELGGTLTLRNLHITNGGGDSGDGAGAIRADGVDLKLSNIRFDSTGVTDPASDGGIVKVNHGNVSIRNSEFLGGYADDVGGAVFIVGGSLTVVGSRFDGNSAAYGGAIFADDSNVSVLKSRFEGNVAGEHDGAIGVYGGSLVVKNSTFLDNSVSNFYGGAIHTMDSDVTVLSSRFEGNSSSANGGAIDLCAEDSLQRARISGSVFVDNSAGGNGGGLGIFCDSWTEVIVVGNRFVENTAGDDGGGLWTAGSSIVLHRNLFVDNQTGDKGGGAAVYKEGAWTPAKLRALGRNIYRSNDASCGGGIALDDGSDADAVALVRGSRFQGNSAADPTAEKVCISSL